jgi:hypothetical protein
LSTFILHSDEAEEKEEEWEGEEGSDTGVEEVEGYGKNGLWPGPVEEAWPESGNQQYPAENLFVFLHLLPGWKDLEYAG